MVHCDDDILEWLQFNCTKDRVLYNALTNHSPPPQVVWSRHHHRCWIKLVCKSGSPLTIGVVMHPVKQEPVHYYRLYESMDK